MQCDRMGPEWIDYVKGEVGPEERNEMDAHLAACEVCRKEVEGLRRTFDALQEELVPIELSAHFRMALADRLEEATDETARVGPASEEQKTRAMRASERHIREMKKPVVTRLWEHARRSPYFAVSLLAHAAALLVIFAILVKMQGAPEAPRLVVERGGPNEEYRLHPQTRFEVPAYLTRRAAPHLSIRAVDVDDGIQVNLALFMMPDDDRDLVLVREERLGCVQGFFADTDEERRAIQKKHESAIVRTIEDYRLTIPTKLVARLEGERDEARDLFVFRLQDRYEFWSHASWKRLDDRYQHLSVASRALRLPLAQAVLPRRRRSG